MTVLFIALKVFIDVQYLKMNSATQAAATANNKKNLQIIRKGGSNLENLESIPLKSYQAHSDSEAGYRLNVIMLTSCN